MKINLIASVKVLKATITFESERLSGCSLQIEGEVLQKQIPQSPQPKAIKTIINKSLDQKILESIKRLIESELCSGLE